MATTVDLGKVRPVWKGSWSGSTAYEVHDMVKNGVNSYICTTAHTSDASTFSNDSANWDDLAQGAEIPSQTGNAGKALKTDGTNLSWGVAGGIVQVVHSGIITSTSYGYSGNGTSVITPLTLSITPTSASNKILWMCTLTKGGSSDAFHGFYLQRNGANLSVGDSAGPSTRYTFAHHQDSGHGTYDTYTMNWNYLDSPNTTSSTEYKLVVQPMRTNGQEFWLNRANNLDDSNRTTGTSSVILMEIAGDVF